MPLNKTPLHQLHCDADADLTDFNGWEMPVQFDSIRTEHVAVRESVGRFDVSHMGEVRVDGPDATELMNVLTTNDVEKLDAGDAQYSCILDDDGILLDDTVVYRYPDRDGYLFVPNAGNDERMANRWSEAASRRDLDADVENVTEETGLIAVQGPDAVETVDDVAAESVGDLGRFSTIRTEIDGVDSLVARTGYTGEDGFEIFFPASESEDIWQTFSDVQACGLGARDTLRLEAGLLLSGQDFDPESEPRTPLEAGLGFVVDLSKAEFVGKEALVEQEDDGLDEEMVGIRLEERAIARAGYPICKDGEEVGHVTSGTMSPTFDVPIAFGYVETEIAEIGTEISVEIRGREKSATIADQRFLNTLETTSEE
ncbi:glycine cleavage system aminomethyltransferase GcvT [Natrarchaeobius chitinivorans]|uniref:Probable aminomethyltransferase n=1 Tax=Natrarchaeobius chitinivorans TaxID=1679083 RepID=A0A3N6N8S0_NATCH|nr:glycine cleavage system aminomethyltransferase GcvT [Natrarchaeobius chitinivorans]RQG94882.1 glycine cleavage system aminomethyltransferase GcvT [Natrarchaeobius chitinivorans]